MFAQRVDRFPRSQAALALLAAALVTGCESSQAPLSGNASVDAAAVPASEAASVSATTEAAAAPMATTGDRSSAPKASETALPEGGNSNPVPVASETDPVATDAAKPAPEQPEVLPPEVENMHRLLNVWIDKQQKRVLVLGEVCRTEGQLEMFACLKNSKEHEAIVAIRKAKAVEINAALIAIGAVPGGPVQFRPAYKPASGPEVEVTVIWTDEKGKRQQMRAQEWIRTVKTGKPLEHNWVFGGSGFWRDEAAGIDRFMAEDGDVICVSNFTSAMLDLPIQSSQEASELQFEAFTEKIPPKGTAVVLILAPKFSAKPADAKSAEEQPAEAKRADGKPGEEKPADQKPEADQPVEAKP